MPEHDLPTSSDPGPNQASRERWGKKVLDAFTSLTQVVTELTRTAERSESQLASLGTKVTDIDKRLAVFAKDISTWKKISWAVLAACISIILTLGGTAFSVVSTENAQTVKIDYLSKSLENNSSENKLQNTNFQSTLKSANDAIAEFRRSLEGIEARSKSYDTKLDRIEKFVTSLEAAKGESNSQFVTQRSFLRAGDLRPRKNREKPLLFTVKLLFTSLSPEKPPRASAELSYPHDERLDLLSIQMQVTGATDNTLTISIAGDASTLDEIEVFLRNNGIIPLDLTIRTPKD